MRSLRHRVLTCARVYCLFQPHELKGQCLFAYVIAKQDPAPSANFVAELRSVVRHEVGAFATPDFILVVSALPKTRSGKIMRRILRKIACQETGEGALGDVSTLAEPAVVEVIIAQANALLAKK
jgi:acetyl-CoA synthetase